MKFITAFIFVCASLLCYAQENPIFQRVAATTSNNIYDTKAWSFNSGAPIRSTPLVKGDFIYFGNASGEFYAINKLTRAVKWVFHAGAPIHSSAIGVQDLIYFSDNTQTLYAVNATNGKLVWKSALGKPIEYPWAFDSFYSSPVIYENKVVIGSRDGKVYMLDQKTGKQIWKYNCHSVLRSTPAVYHNSIFIGDIDGCMHAIDSKSGSSMWDYKTSGDTMKNENFGFDRRAILSSAVVYRDKIYFGSREGFLYCVNLDGQFLWKADHKVSWCNSTVSIKDNIVVATTSDGHFIQAVDVTSGKEIWKHKSVTLFWSSPLIVNDKVYAGGFDGGLYCLELSTGKMVSQFTTSGIIISSAILNDGLMYVGSDDGNLYALKSHPDVRTDDHDKLKRFVFYETGSNFYFRNGSDLTIKRFLNGQGYKTINTDSLVAFFKTGEAANSVIVFASIFMNRAIIEGGQQSLLRQYLDHGGRVVLSGQNPLVFDMDPTSKTAVAFNIPGADSVLGLRYGPNDTRSLIGPFPCFPTEKGKEFNLPDFWTGSLVLPAEQADIILGKNENGGVVSFAKKYSNNGWFVQLVLSPDAPNHLDALIKTAEWKL